MPECARLTSLIATQPITVPGHTGKASAKTTLGESLTNAISVLLGAVLVSLLAYSLLKSLLFVLVGFHGGTG